MLIIEKFHFLLTFSGGGKLSNEGGKKMSNRYVAVLYVNNMRTEEQVIANDSFSAKKLIEAKYPNCKINWVYLPRLVK